MLPALLCTLSWKRAFIGSSFHASCLILMELVCGKKRNLETIHFRPLNIPIKTRDVYS